MGTLAINVGDVIRGKYKVEQVLGAGGMGVVLAAWDPDLERRVAVKVLQPEMLVHPEIVQRFLREARAAAKIQSDHVAQVVEVSLLDDGTPFMVMEYLEGHDLSHEARGAESSRRAHRHAVRRTNLSGHDDRQRKLGRHPGHVGELHQCCERVRRRDRRCACRRRAGTQ
jgi:serine/threonine protein kinase